MYTLAALGHSQPPLITTGDHDPRDAWRVRRAEILRTWLSVVGELPEPTPPDVVLGERRDLGGAVAQHLTFTTPGDLPVPAYLLAPDPLPAEPRPGILALHQTTPIGKNEVCGLGGDPDLAYGLELARLGCIVLAPDCITMGERIAAGGTPIDTSEHYRGQRLSAVGRMLVDHRQALSVLESHSGLPVSRLGVIGHSLGGYNAFFLAGLDARVAATVCSCGFGTFGGDPTPQRWSRAAGFDHLPRLRSTVGAGRVPWEWHEVLSLVAPRPLLMHWDEHDEVFPQAIAVRAALRATGDLYGTLGAGALFTSDVSSVGHRFPRAARDLAYAFLRRHLTDDA